jgi:RNA-binding protein YhbY
LVKVRFAGGDRSTRAALCPEISRATASAWVGSVGATALFFLPRAGVPDGGPVPR